MSSMAPDIYKKYILDVQGGYSRGLKVMDDDLRPEISKLISEPRAHALISSRLS